jgi:hypothetical protein
MASGAKPSSLWRPRLDCFVAALLAMTASHLRTACHVTIQAAPASFAKHFIKQGLHGLP